MKMLFVGLMLFVTFLLDNHYHSAVGLDSSENRSSRFTRDTVKVDQAEYDDKSNLFGAVVWVIGNQGNFMTGVLVSPRQVITSALHLVESTEADIYTVLNFNQLNTAIDGETKFKSTNIKYDPQFTTSPPLGLSAHDLAIITLPSDIPDITDPMTLFSLPKKGDQVIKDSCQVIGMSGNNNIPGIVKVSPFPLLCSKKEREDCRLAFVGKSFPSEYQFDEDTQICGGYTNKILNKDDYNIAPNNVFGKGSPMFCDTVAGGKVLIGIATIFDEFMADKEMSSQPSILTSLYGELKFLKDNGVTGANP